MNKVKINSLIFLLILSVSVGVSAQSAQIKVMQEGILLNNTTDESPDSSAVLDVISLTKGVLFPRLTQVQINQITSPAQGLLVFNIDKRTYEFWNGDTWIAMGISIPLVAPKAPANLLASVYFDEQINLAWADSSDNETGFEIWRSLTSGSGYELVGSVGANTATFSDVNLTVHTDYYYVVVANNSGLLSDYSNEIFVQTANPFISQWNTSNQGLSTSNQVSLPLGSGTYAMAVSWGDGEVDSIFNRTQPEVKHSYSAPGTYTVKISGTCKGFTFADNGDKLKLIEVSRWGDLKPTSIGVFSGCSNLVVTATDILDLSFTTTMADFFSGCSSLTTVPNINSWNTSSITNMARLFSGASIFNSPIGNWDVNSVTNLNGIFHNAQTFNQPLNAWNTGSLQSLEQSFYGASSFNQPLGLWNTSSVTSMKQTFFNTILFNQDISSWDVGNVTTMQDMFQNATSFNQPLNSWDVNSVTNMTFMFYKATSFNQPLNSWNLSQLASLAGMFRDATSFNQNISSWDMSNIGNMSQLFMDASSFNQPLNSWDVSNVTNMSTMFRGTSFNQPLSSWDVSSVTNMGSMFRFNTQFDQDISSWDVSNVTTFDKMFNQASAFNQPIGTWTTSSLVNANNMLYGANAFDQNLSGWDVSSIATLDGFLYNASISTANYDLTLISWSAQSVQNGVVFDVGSSKYTLGGPAAAAKLELQNNHSWSITDGGGL